MGEGLGVRGRVLGVRGELASLEEVNKNGGEI